MAELAQDSSSVLVRLPSCHIDEKNDLINTQYYRTWVTSCDNETSIDPSMEPTKVNDWEDVIARAKTISNQ